MEDLEQSIGALRDALHHCPTGHPRRMGCLLSLSSALVDQMMHSEDAAGLGECIALQKEALQLAPPGHHAHGGALISMSYTMLVCFRQTGNTADINSSLAFIWEAVSRYPLKLPGDISRIHHFATILVVRFQHLHEQQDCRQAFGIFNKILRTLEPGHPIRIQTLLCVSQLLMDEFNKDRNLVAAAESLCSAMREPQAMSRHMLSLSCELLIQLQVRTATGELHVQQQLLAAFRLFTPFLPRIAYLGLDLASRLKVLKKTSQVTMSGCLCALQLGCPDSAVEILEEGRFVSTLQSFKLRSQFTGLPTKISDKLSQIAARLESISTQKDIRSWSPRDGFEISPEVEAAYARRLTTEFEKTLLDARKMPGFENFLLPQAYHVLAEAAQGGPVIILLAHLSLSHAIIIRSPDATPQQVSLPHVSAKWLAESSDTLQGSRTASGQELPNDKRAVRFRPCLEGDTTSIILEELWTKICKPIVDHLGLKVSLFEAVR